MLPGKQHIGTKKSNKQNNQIFCNFPAHEPLPSRPQDRLPEWRRLQNRARPYISISQTGKELSRSSFIFNIQTNFQYKRERLSVLCVNKQCGCFLVQPHWKLATCALLSIIQSKTEMGQSGNMGKVGEKCRKLKKIFHQPTHPS